MSARKSDSPKRKLSAQQIIFYFLCLLIVASMILATIVN